MSYGAAADLANEIAVIPFAMTNIENYTSTTAGLQSVHLQNLGIEAMCGATANLYYMVKVTNAYIPPKNSEVLSLLLKSMYLN